MTANCTDMSSSPVGIQQCQDFLMFQSALRDMRLLDDKIIYALNTSIPTTSFKDKVNASEQCQVLLDKVSTVVVRYINYI